MAVQVDKPATSSICVVSDYTISFIGKVMTFNYTTTDGEIVTYEIPSVEYDTYMTAWGLTNLESDLDQWMIDQGNAVAVDPETTTRE